MIHLLPIEDGAERADCPEILARMAGLRRALLLVDDHGGGPAADLDEDQALLAWDRSGPALRQCFDQRSERTIAAASAGLEALLAGRRPDRQPSDPALRLVAEEIRAGLADLVTLLGATGETGATPAPSPWA